MTWYPSADDVVEVHKRLIERFGGAAGLRDRGALEAAVARPRSGYYRDLIGEPAALWESLWQNHPFVDGNKRVGVTVAAAFLRCNGLRLVFEDGAAYKFLIGLYERNGVRRGTLEEWLRRHVKQEGETGAVV